MRARRVNPWLLACLAAMGSGLVWRLGGYPLFEPDEGRNAEVAREMAAQHAWILPTLDGLPYVDKPVLYFATDAVAQRILGSDETAARLPSLLFTLATAVLVAWFARRRLSRRGAWTATIAYLATPFTLAYARTVIFDSALSLFVVAALIAFYLAIEAPPADDSGARRETWPTAAVGWIAIALGILTKGPVALALPLLVAVPYAIWRKRTRRMFEPVAVLAGVAALLPWLFAIARRVPGFFHYALVVETAERLTTDTMHRSGPWWYFVPILVGAALPWSVIAIAGIRRRLLRRDGTLDPFAVYLALWILVPLAFFSLSQSKRPQYILPLMPAFALLVALFWERDERLPGVRWGGAVLVALGLGLIAFHGVFLRYTAKYPAIAPAIPPAALALGAATAAAGAGALFFAWLGRREPVLLMLTLPVAVIPLIGLPLLQAIGRERSARALASDIAPVLGAHAQVVAVETFPLSLPFYLGRTIILSTVDGRELTSNYVPRHLERLRALPKSPLRPAGWWREAALTCTVPRVFVVAVTDAAAREFLAERLPLLGAAAKWAAYGPCERGPAVARSTP